LYAATDFSFDSFNWKTQFLYNRRETKAHSWRQFYPTVYSEAADDYFQVIMPFPSDQKITVDYFYGTTKFDGQFKSTDSWTWEVNAGFSRSTGKYGALSIDVDRAGDLVYTDDDMPVNYFDPGFLNGTRMNELIAAVGQYHTGKTTYDQTSANAIFSGNLFTLPAGDVASAFGVEFRRYKIDDTPSDFALADRSWNSTSAGPTRGTDKVKEAFAEVDVPLLKGIPGIESLSVNLSGRVFEYDSVPGSDHVWKTGVNWQI